MKAFAVTSGAIRACFVLSAGRTGTVALAKRLGALFPTAAVRHEPSPARLELLLGNLRNETGLGLTVVRTLFLRTRRRRIDRLPADNVYVEINPMLCPIADLLPELGIPFTVIHMVRHPATWAQSITAFGASSPFRAIIDYIPFAKPYPRPRPAGWSAMEEQERALWRWRECNDRILALRPKCAGYALVRYEDLFSADVDLRAAAFEQVAQMIPGDPVDQKSSIDTAERHNPRPGSKIAALPPGMVQAVCGDLARRFGYQIG